MSAADGLIQRFREEIAEWGHLPAAMRFKQSLAEALGPLHAFTIAKSELEIPECDDLKFRRVTPLHDYAKSFGVDYRHIWDGGAPFTLREPKIFGTRGTAKTRIAGRTRSAYLACIADARVRSRSSMIMVGDEALCEHERGEGSQIADNPEYDAAVFHALAEGYWTIDARNPPEFDEAFLLLGAHTIDFGHWMVEYLPRYGLALRAGLAPNVPLLIDERIPQRMKEALQVVSPGAPLIEIPYLSQAKVRRLWCAPNPNFMGVYPTIWTDALWERMAAHPGRFADLIVSLQDRLVPDNCVRRPGTKLFLARAPTLRKKRLVNHAEIEEIARERGFDVVHPEKHSFAEQANMAAQADVIAAPEGSNCFLAFFARPGARICVLSPPHTFPLIDTCAIFSALGSYACVLAGESLRRDEFSPFWDDYRIEPEHFKEVAGLLIGAADGALPRELLVGA